MGKTSRRQAPLHDALGTRIKKPARRNLYVTWVARVAGVEIPNSKKVECALTYIYGIGFTTSRQILAETGGENKRTRELTEEELQLLRKEVEKYTIEGDLRRFVAQNIKRLKDIQCYRGKRHIAKLPVRGQSTKNNARTRKGKAIAIAAKKK